MTLRRSTLTLCRAIAAGMLMAVAPSPTRAADPAPFDLAGPALRVTVTRDKVTLPIGEVPSLSVGDTLDIRADLPDDQRARFLLLSAFLNGATNPPPKAWIATAQTWKRKDKDRLLTLTVPKGARQLVLFLVPDTGGAPDTITGAVRGRPGEFVRATRDLNQASLDRSRLDAFMGAIKRQENTHPEYLKSIAPTLARSLAIKLNADCLAKVIELQAACLVENRDTLVLADVHSSSMAETLVGAPTDLALQLSYTREGGLGYYSPYIAVARDIARIFGAFNNPQLNYLPTLSTRQGADMALLLNTAPSFTKPKSVLVVAMPAIATDSLPRLRNAADGALCGSRPGLVLPVDGAPLIFSTAYARDMRAQVTFASGRTVELPVEARADQGGYVVTGPMPAGEAGGPATAKLHGFWGFDPIEGPRFDLQFPTTDGWRAADGAPTLVTGRENQLTLTGPAPACVESVTMKRDDAAAQPVTFTPAGGQGITVKLPLDGVKPGTVTLTVNQYGTTAPSTIKLRAYEQAGKLDALTLHAGDRWGMLAGQRLDQVASVTIGGLTLKPDGLAREGNVDRLRLVADTAAEALKPGNAVAKVALDDGRTVSLPTTVRPARPRVTLIETTFVPKGITTGIALQLPASGDTILPDTARLIFSIKAAEGTRLLPSDAVEVSALDGESLTRIASGPDLRLQSSDTAVATLDPATLGPSAFGPLRFRLIRGGEAGDWQPLATLARMPQIDAIDCATACALKGKGLFLIEAVAATPAFDKGVVVPLGYTGTSLAVPAPQDRRLYLRLRDAPTQVVTLAAGRANPS